MIEMFWRNTEYGVEELVKKDNLTPLARLVICKGVATTYNLTNLAKMEFYQTETDIYSKDTKWIIKCIKHNIEKHVLAHLNFNH